MQSHADLIAKAAWTVVGGVVVPDRPEPGGRTRIGSITAVQHHVIDDAFVWINVHMDAPDEGRIGRTYHTPHAAAETALPFALAQSGFAETHWPQRVDVFSRANLNPCQQRRCGTEGTKCATTATTYDRKVGLRMGIARQRGSQYCKGPEYISAMQDAPRPQSIGCLTPGWQ